MLATFLAVGLAAGCNPPSDSAWQVYEDAGSQAAPPRLVLGLDAGSGDGSSGTGTDPGGGAGGGSGAGGGGAGGAGGGGGGSSGADTIVSCNVARMDCMMGQMCLPSVFAEKPDTGGICYPAGDKGYKEKCIQFQECGSGLVCSPNAMEGCRYGCDPTAPACPDGGKCSPLPRFAHTGYCADP